MSSAGEARGGGLGGVSAGTLGEKRKIGGHFGAAVGASSKRGRAVGASWRTEIDEEEEPARGGGGGAVPGGGDSDSDVAIDPGTPLPSESEEEAPNGAPAAAAAAAAPAAAEAPAPGGADGAGDGAPGGPGESSEPAAGGADAADAAAAEGQQPAAADAAAKKAPGESAAAAVVEPSPGAGPPVVITMELVVSESVAGSLRILLSDGLAEAIERRLVACVPPEGAAVDSAVRGAMCTFGGHEPLRRTRGKRGKAVSKNGEEGAKAEGAEEAEGEGAEGEGADEPAEEVEAAAGGAASSSAQVPKAGLLYAPTSGPGLALMLPLDASSGGSGGTYSAEVVAALAGHRPVGHVLSGRAALRRLSVLAPLAKGPKPLQPVALRVAGTAAQANSGAPAPAEAESSEAKSEEELLPHPFLLLSRPPLEALNGRAKDPFILDPEERPLSKDSVTAEELDLAELEINCRDAEVSELKQMAFGRERQTGVAASEEVLLALEARLGKPFDDEKQPAASAGDAAKAEAGAVESAGGEGAAAGGLEGALAGQRWWLQQRLQHLLRVLRKLR